MGTTDWRTAYPGRGYRHSPYLVLPVTFLSSWTCLCVLLPYPGWFPRLTQSGLLAFPCVFFPMAQLLALDVCASSSTQPSGSTVEILTLMPVWSTAGWGDIPVTPRHQYWFILRPACESQGGGRVPTDKATGISRWAFVGFLTIKHCSLSA